jgi:hypothetical protein
LSGDFSSAACAKVVWGSDASGGWKGGLGLCLLRSERKMRWDISMYINKQARRTLGVYMRKLFTTLSASAMSRSTSAERPYLQSTTKVLASLVK